MATSDDHVSRLWPAELDEFAHLIGANRLLTQGPGGNISYKDGNHLWIKASGTHLKDALNKQIFVGLDLSEARSNIQNNIEHFPIRFGDINNGLRSSIETSMHAQIYAPYVAHVHSVGSVSMSILLDQSRAIRSSSKFCKVSYAQYIRPGIGLARAVREAIEPDSKAVLLGNHGLTVWGDSPSECIDTIENLEAIWAAEFQIDSKKATVEGLSWKNLLAQGILVPDEVVFLGKSPFLTDSSGDNHLDIMSPLTGVKYKEVEWIADFVDVLSLIAKNVRNYKEVRYLTDHEIAELLDWEAEKFRQGKK
jgi:rhamnose utilization protein RhaD (predicted bifunctional aldolase and dehydrogenase)